jgi:hypothetical protein
LLILLVFGEWCNGSTTDSDSVCLGSNPSSPATIYKLSYINDLTIPFEQKRCLLVTVRRVLRPARKTGIKADLTESVNMIANRRIASR